MCAWLVHLLLLLCMSTALCLPKLNACYALRCLTGPEAATLRTEPLLRNARKLRALKTQKTEPTAPRLPKLSTPPIDPGCSNQGVIKLCNVCLTRHECSTAAAAQAWLHAYAASKLPCCGCRLRHVMSTTWYVRSTVRSYSQELDSPPIDNMDPTEAILASDPIEAIESLLPRLAILTLLRSTQAVDCEGWPLYLLGGLRSQAATTSNRDRPATTIPSESAGERPARAMGEA